MKHARADYDRIQDPDGLIPADEPVFLLRAQDSVAPRAVKFYATLAKEAGADAAFVDAVQRHARAMLLWPVVKVPDMPAGADVSRETVKDAQRRLEGMITGAVLDFVSYVTSDGAGQFRERMRSGAGEAPDVAAVGHAMVEGLKDWASARGIDHGTASTEWRKLIPPAAGKALVR